MSRPWYRFRYDTVIIADVLKCVNIIFYKKMDKKKTGDESLVVAFHSPVFSGIKVIDNLSNIFS
jgi:hypothetical protein